MSAVSSSLPAPDPFIAELEQAMSSMPLQNDLYRPSSFWAQAAEDIAEQVRRHGVENFRRLPLPLGYFVPTYGMPGNGFDDRTGEALEAAVAGEAKPMLTVEQLLSGHSSALADFRVLQAADGISSAKPCLQSFSESAVGNPVEQFTFEGRRFSRSSLNYLLGLCLLKRRLGTDEIGTVVEIGGGFGSLGEILLSGGDPRMKYVDLDIPPNSTIARHYLSAVLGPERVAGFAQTADRGRIDIAELPAASALCNWQIEHLHGEVDLFVNFISFQEMEPPIVRNYLTHVERLGARWVLLRNMREGKQRRTTHSVGVIEPIVSEDYLHMLPGYELIERNVSPFGYRTVDGYHSELLLLRRHR